MASRWAARKLITPTAFLEAARTERRIDVIARALWVTPAVVHDYLDALTAEEFRIMRKLVGHELV
jgi:hypothetical protein